MERSKNVEFKFVSLVLVVKMFVIMVIIVYYVVDCVDENKC